MGTFGYSCQGNNDPLGELYYKQLTLAGRSHWQLPDSPADLKTLYWYLQLSSGDARLMAHGTAGPFRNLQPFSYW